jgi:predicted secreted protein
VSLSSEPAFSRLKDRMVCGYRDITGEDYAGRSGIHDVGGNAIQTTNGAGPHNLQLFVMNADGIVLHALPGYWDPGDLVRELDLAERLAAVHADRSLTDAQKAERFREMHVAHVQDHPHDMVRRSRMQSFDQKFEARRRLYTSDTIVDRDAVAGAITAGTKPPPDAFKTTDRIMHERMSARPFVPFDRFDVAEYVDYGRPKYDKREDSRNERGRRMDAGSGSAGSGAGRRRRRGY